MGALKLIIMAKNVPTNILRYEQPCNVLWNTNGGKFATLHEVELEFKLPEFCTTKKYKTFFHSR